MFKAKAWLDSHDLNDNKCKHLTLLLKGHPKYTAIYKQCLSTFYGIMKNYNQLNVWVLDKCMP